MEFVKDSLGNNYSNPNMSEQELQLFNFCNNNNDLEGIYRNITEEIIKQYNENIESARLNIFVNTSKIKKFKDFCNEDIFDKYFPTTDLIYNLYSISNSKHLFINTLTIETFNIKKYYLPIFIILGLLGNSLSATVFFRKKMRSFSSSIYLGVLAISDISFLLMIFIQWLRIMEILEMYNLHWLMYSENFLVYFLKFLSVWLIIAFTIERYIVTKHLLLRQSWCTVNRAKIVVITLIGLAIFYSILYVFLESTSINMKDQDIKVLHIFKHVSSESIKQDSNIYVMTNAIIMFTLPALIIIIFNTLTRWHIYLQNHINKTLISTSGTSSENTQITVNEMPENKITKMLILVSSTFVFLKLPAHIHFFIESDMYKDGINWTIMSEICDLLNTTKYSINFVLYCAMEQNFRRELIRTFTKCEFSKKQKCHEDGQI
ncbi:putative G-protein coupled receptor F59B2.13 [Linepithema humile]|uniref:putative G-protein coupled receptor F59B2.13 n=1 Tax=Linepithema humile TaxID=83485 RepID=UPI00062379CD|nr:PREDICTED: thyrotropin-releasing hormone receptor-like [Linepithema humile]